LLKEDSKPKNFVESGLPAVLGKDLEPLVEVVVNPS